MENNSSSIYPELSTTCPDTPGVASGAPAHATNAMQIINAEKKPPFRFGINRREEMRKTGIFDNKKMPNLNGGFFSALIFIKFYRNIKNITRKFLRISPLFPFPRKKRIPQRPGPRATCRVGGCRPRDPGNKTCRAATQHLHSILFTLHSIPCHCE